MIVVGATLGSVLFEVALSVSVDTPLVAGLTGVIGLIILGLGLANLPLWA